jgi:hypothetical protein
VISSKDCEIRRKLGSVQLQKQQARMATTTQGRNIPEGKILPRIGVIYSDSENNEFSGESLWLAHYMAGLLALTGYADVRLVGMRPDGSPLPDLDTSQKKRIAILKPGDTKPTEIPVSS